MRNLIFLILLLPTNLFGTPDDGIRIYEVLIGYNSNYYYSIQTKHYPTGTYYKRIDSSFVVQRDLAKGMICNKIFLRSAIHTDKSTLEDWETEEYFNDEFDFPRFIIENDIKYLYPEVYSNNNYRPYRFKIDAAGLKTCYRDESAIISDLDRIEISSPSIKKALEIQEKDRQQFPNVRIEYVKVFDFIGDEKYLFFIIETELEPEYQQSILVIKSDDFLSLRLELINRD